MPCDTTDGTGEVITVQRLDVLDLEGFLSERLERGRRKGDGTNDVELFETEEGDRVFGGETEGVGGEEVGGAREGGRGGSMF